MSFGRNCAAMTPDQPRTLSNGCNCAEMTVAGRRARAPGQRETSTRLGTNRVGSVAAERRWMFCRRPSASMPANIDEPPYDTNGSGTPVTGMMPRHMPVTGVPLPFVSYGGSSMFAGMLALGLLQNIHLRSAATLPTRFTNARVLVSR